MKDLAVSLLKGTLSQSPQQTTLVTDTLAALGDYLRERELVTGYGFEHTDKGIICRFQNCRFASTAHEVAEQGMVCAQCPVLQLTQKALEKRFHDPILREHGILVGEVVTCMFHLTLTPAVEHETRRTRNEKHEIHEMGNTKYTKHEGE